MFSADLSIIGKRLESEAYYLHLDIFVAEMRRMFNNAMAYNAPHTYYYAAAQKYILIIIFDPVCSHNSLVLPFLKAGRSSFLKAGGWNSCLVIRKSLDF